MRSAWLASLIWFAICAAPPAEAMVDIAVDLSTQTMTVAADDGARYEWPVSTGRRGYPTPRGVFRPQRMVAMTYSLEYENAPMPHSIFFTGGYAIHGSYEVAHLGRPVSHGCVRLAPGNAAVLYDMVKREGARITIYGSPPYAPSYAESGSRHGSHAAASRHEARTDGELGYPPDDLVAPSADLWLQDPLGW